MLRDEIKPTIHTNDSLLGLGNKSETVVRVPVGDLHQFKDHPFKVLDDDDMQEMVASIKENGVTTPLIVRVRDEGGYEIVSGHRRQKASELAGIKDVPVIVRDLSYDEAVIIMCSTNFHQRKNLLPSEKAFAYKMQLEAMKRQAGRPKDNYSQVANNYETSTSSEELSQELGISKDNIYRYIRLTELIPPLLDRVDRGEMNIIPAVYLSYLDKDIEQPDMERIIDSGYIPNVAQAKMLKEISQMEGLTPEKMFEILRSEDRIHEHYSIPTGAVKKCFPPEYNAKQIKEKIIEIVNEWFKNQEKNKSAIHESER